MKKPFIRCSSLERVLKCGHSVFLPSEKLTSKYSEDGENQHQIAYNFLSSDDKKIKQLNWDKMNENTKTYCRYIHNIQKTTSVVLEKHYQKEYRNFILSGHPDCWYMGDDMIEIIDLKNGYQDISILNNQLKGYALLVKDQKSVTKFKLTIIQKSSIECLCLYSEEIENIIPEIEKALFERNITPCGVCQFCPSKIHCIAMRVDYKTQNHDEMIYIVKNKTHIISSIKHIETVLESKIPDSFKEVKWGKGTRKIFIGDKKC